MKMGYSFDELFFFEPGYCVPGIVSRYGLESNYSLQGGVLLEILPSLIFTLRDISRNGTFEYISAKMAALTLGK